MHAAPALIDLDWNAMFFQGWGPVVRILVVGTLAYVGLVVLLRVSGKRTLSKFNAFDFVVTIAFGSMLASIFLSRDVALVEGLTALALLIGLQAVVTAVTVRWPRFRAVVKSTPSLLYYDGHWFDRELVRTRTSRSEVHAAVRGQGIGTMDDVAAVVLETEGQVSVIKKSPDLNNEVMEHVSRDTG